MIQDNNDIRFVSDAKIDFSFPTAEFPTDGFTTYGHGRNENK